MKKAIFISLVCLCFTMFLLPVSSPAFEKIELGGCSEITVWGFVRNNIGIFTQTQEFTNSGNQLSTARTWLRGYMDLKLNEQFRVYSSLQFVWEPWYKVEEGNAVSENGGTQQHQKSGWKTYSEFDDVNDVIREVYVEWKPTKKSTFKFGRQIAIWGEALTDQVGDVIQPIDTRFAFAFANVEDVRIPQYMIRGLHDIDSLSSSFEWIINPLVTQSNYSVNRRSDFSLGGVEQRFAFHPEDRFYPGRSSAPTMPINPATIPDRFDFSNLSSLVGWPFATSFYEWLPGFIPGIGNSWAPNEIPYSHTTYPKNFEDTRFGARTSTMVGGYQFGFSYWHTQSYDLIVSRGGYVGMVYFPLAGENLPLREYEFQYPTYDIIGFYMNKQLPWPGVMRAELIYSPNKPFNSFNMISPYASFHTPFTNPYATSNESGVVRRDYVKYMLAYDLAGFIYPSWHKTAPFDITIEHLGEWIPNSSELQNLIYNDNYPNYHASFNARISTNWFYNVIATELIVGYDTWGNSGIIMPAVKWMPGWQNSKFSAELKYIGIWGDNDYSGVSMFRKKDMVILTTQLNF